MSLPELTIEVTPLDLPATLETNYLGRATMLMAQVVADKTKETIRAGENPYGDPYPALKVETIKARIRRNITGVEPLLASEALYNSIDAIRVGSQGAGVVLLSYYKYHQYGTARIPVRSMLPIRNQEIVIPDEWQKDIDEGLNDILDDVVK